MPERSSDLIFPFDAVIGSKDAKRALLCLATDTHHMSVMIRGPSGTGKSVLARSLGGILRDCSIINIPFHITDEQLFGGIDLEKAVTQGRTAVQGGILSRANGNIILIDNANLMDPRRLASIMDCLDTGEVKIERDGISASYRCDASLIATMDPLEKEVGDSIMDRFDMCVSTSEKLSKEMSDRVSLSALSYANDPIGFCEQYSKINMLTSESIVSARKMMSSIKLSEEDISSITDLCIGLNVEGHRGDIAVARVSVALASLAGRDHIIRKDISDAAVMCLAYRRGKVSEDNTEDIDDNDMSEDEYRKEVFDGKHAYIDETNIPDDVPDIQMDEDVPFEIEAPVDLIDEVSDRIEAIGHEEYLRLHEIAGVDSRRRDAISFDGRGRYNGAAIPKGRVSDLAFDATLRAAAPHQATRPSNGLCITIEPQDIREKVRTHKDGCSFLFLVDLSGSMVSDKMIESMNDAIKAMLKDGYVNRDRVGLMTFNEHEVHTPVLFTRSLESVSDALRQSPSGGCTPLGQALLDARAYVLNYLRTNPSERCYIMVMTDGETTTSVIPERDAMLELKKIAGVCNIHNTEWVVIDTKLTYSRRNNARRLAVLLGARYLRLDSLSEF